MATSIRTRQPDTDLILAGQSANGGRYWSSSDGRWGIGSPFSTIDCGLMLHELGMRPGDKIARAISSIVLACQTKDGRIRPGPGLAVQPCHTANAARLLCRLGVSSDPRLAATYDHLLATQAPDGGWRCSVLKLGANADTDASNPGVTLFALDAFRFRKDLRNSPAADRAVDSLLEHWGIKRPLGPCRFGIGSRFMKVEYPFLRYNLFYFVYVLSFFPRARRDASFQQALEALGSKVVAGKIVIEHQNPRLSELSFCREGSSSRAATRRYRELLGNLAA